jgi:hypothetical protein
MNKIDIHNHIEELFSYCSKFLEMTLEEWEEIDPPTEIGEYGNKYWKNKKNQPHRDRDLPAIILKNGTRYWCQNGKVHRDDDLPAISYLDGRESYYKNGERYFP